MHPEESSSCGIYQIKNIITQEIYIGSTQFLSKRRLEHFRLLKKNKHPNKNLQVSWNSYREENLNSSYLIAVLKGLKKSYKGWTNCFYNYLVLKFFGSFHSYSQYPCKTKMYVKDFYTNRSY